MQYEEMHGKKLQYIDWKKRKNSIVYWLKNMKNPHSSKILTTQQDITRGVSSVGKPCRP